MKLFAILYFSLKHNLPLKNYCSPKDLYTLFNIWCQLNCSNAKIIDLNITKLSPCKYNNGWRYELYCMPWPFNWCLRTAVSRSAVLVRNSAYPRTSVGRSMNGYRMVSFIKSIIHIFVYCTLHLIISFAI